MRAVGSSLAGRFAPQLIAQSGYVIGHVCRCRGRIRFWFYKVCGSMRYLDGWILIGGLDMLHMNLVNVHARGWCSRDEFARLYTGLHHYHNHLPISSHLYNPQIPKENTASKAYTTSKSKPKINQSSIRRQKQTAATSIQPTTKSRRGHHRRTYIPESKN